MIDDVGLKVEQGVSERSDSSKDKLQPPEGAFLAGQIIKVIVANAEGSIDVAHFRNQSDAQAYLSKHYQDATPVTTDTTYFALDSLDPYVPRNQYLVFPIDVWTTTSPTTDQQTNNINTVTTVFIDKNPPGAQPHQITLEQQRAIGVWKDADEAIQYYQRTQPKKTIRDNRIFGNVASRYSPVGKNEIYLQTRPVITLENS
jgi:hypothetical protein